MFAMQTWNPRNSELITPNDRFHRKEKIALHSTRYRKISRVSLKWNVVPYHTRSNLERCKWSPCIIEVRWQVNICISIHVDERVFLKIHKRRRIFQIYLFYYADIFLINMWKEEIYTKSSRADSLSFGSVCKLIFIKIISVWVSNLITVFFYIYNYFW